MKTEEIYDKLYEVSRILYNYNSFSNTLHNITLESDGSFLLNYAQHYHQCDSEYWSYSVSEFEINNNTALEISNRIKFDEDKKIEEEKEKNKLKELSDQKKKEQQERKQYEILKQKFNQ